MNPSSAPPTDARAIYGEGYAERYGALYIDPWRRKHQLNLDNLTSILDGLEAPEPVWIDMACGQAWHFAQFQGRGLRMLGLDLSPAQLARARAAAPEASFVRADMARAPIAPGSADLVTSFWAAYAYLDDAARIRAVVADAAGWVRPGGAFYMEVLLAKDLESFNASRFAEGAGFRVVPRSSDYVAWAYEDVGGLHLMTSPPLELFTEALSRAFDRIETVHDGGFMVHVRATNKSALISHNC